MDGARNKDAILVSFSHLLCFRLSSFSTSLLAKAESLPSHLPAPSLQAPYPILTLQPPSRGGNGQKVGLAHTCSPQPFPRGDASGGSANPSWSISQVVANLFYRWDGIFAAIVLEMLSRHFASARHNLSGATQPALENAAWPHSIMPLTLKPNSLLITLFFPKAECLQAERPQCSVTIAVPSPHTENYWEFFSGYPFMLVGAQDHQGEWGRLYFYLV